ncbi:hypothetical protein PRIPAC_85501 [Pristionchus pacificus]|uniref:Tyrosine-protein kinase n=1 Tax=Pristionchus pacificus TaxID=54126 RepID=A0A2A6BS21_PRIPA|nr:hypothetical protein PRIPAC_85501 [Pristionchus pacificus]|eukprot:PDM68739.1 protein kinase [Pristionchus pacificus]
MFAWLVYGTTIVFSIVLLELGILQSRVAVGKTAEESYTSNDVFIIKSREVVAARAMREINGAYILACRSVSLPKEIPELKGSVRAHLHISVSRVRPDPEYPEYRNPPSSPKDPAHSCIYDYVICTDLKGMMFRSAVNQRILAFACRVVARTNEPRERLKALHDHAPTNTRKFLTFKKDDEFELVDAMKHDGWWWCNLDCSRADAEKELSDNKFAPGFFIVRPSSTNRNYWQALSLSIKSGRVNAEGQAIIHHYEIERKDGQMRIKFHLRDDYVEVAFPSLTKLVQYYARYPSAVRPRLTYSVKKEFDAWEIDVSEIDKGAFFGRGNLRQARPDFIVSTCMDTNIMRLEATTARRLSHENIVRIVGVCKTGGLDFYIVTEFLPGGDLKDYLEKYAKETAQVLSNRQYIEIAQKIASAMAHLEINKIVYRDLAARNVLVGQSLDIIKLVDFGLARSLDDKTYYRSQRKEFPLKWTAPEAWVFYGPDGRILQEGLSTSASDVWSFAVVLWEVYSMGLPPYGNREKLSSQRISEGKQVSGASRRVPGEYGSKFLI